MLEDRLCLVSRNYPRSHDRDGNWYLNYREVQPNLEMGGDEDEVARKVAKQSFDHRRSGFSISVVMSTPHQTERAGDDNSDTSSLIPAIGYDNSISCLLRCPRAALGAIASLNRIFRKLVRGGKLYELRRKSGIIEHWVNFSCQLLKWEAFDPNHRRWMHLPVMNPNRCFRFVDKESLAVGTREHGRVEYFNMPVF